MANPEHFEILKQGVDVWNRWREKNPEAKAIGRIDHIDIINSRIFKINNH